MGQWVIWVSDMDTVATLIVIPYYAILYVSKQEEQLTSVSEQLQQSEGMRRRLHEQVTELQGRLALEEQRSKVCSVM